MRIYKEIVHPEEIIPEYKEQVIDYTACDICGKHDTENNVLRGVYYSTFYARVLDENERDKVFGKHINFDICQSCAENVVIPMIQKLTNPIIEWTEISWEEEDW